MPKVLIADDSLSVRKVAERLLTAAGFDVALAANGEEALAGLTATRPDLVIADVIMPDKSGFEICAEVRSHATLSGTPVLLISGVVDEEVTRQAVACKADGVIKKPFQGSSLQDRVTALLASRQPPPVPETETEDTEPADTAGAPRVFRISEEQLENLRETANWAREVEARLTEEQKRVAELEDQNYAFRETAMLAAARIQELELKLAEEEQRAASLIQRVSEMEHAAMCAQKMAELFAEISRLGPKP
jgi:DNA-binding response OmpR family regulator